jgi:hypothetical protein
MTPEISFVLQAMNDVGVISGTGDMAEKPAALGGSG